MINIFWSIYVKYLHPHNYHSWITMKTWLWNIRIEMRINLFSIHSIKWIEWREEDNITNMNWFMKEIEWMTTKWIIEKGLKYNHWLKMIWINHSINTNKNIIIKLNWSMIMIDKILSVDLLMMSWIIQFKIILMELRWLWLFCSYNRFYSSSMKFIIRMT